MLESIGMNSVSLTDARQSTLRRLWRTVKNWMVSRNVKAHRKLKTKISRRKMARFSTESRTRHFEMGKKYFFLMHAKWISIDVYSGMFQTYTHTHSANLNNNKTKKKVEKMDAKKWIVFDAIIWLCTSECACVSSKYGKMFTLSNALISPFFSRVYCSKWINWTLESGKPIFEQNERNFCIDYSTIFSFIHPFYWYCCRHRRCFEMQVEIGANRSRFSPQFRILLRIYAHTHTAHTYKWTRNER